MFSALKSLYSKPLPLAEAKAELIKLTRNYDHKGITALCKRNKGDQKELMLTTEGENRIPLLQLCIPSPSSIPSSSSSSSSSTSSSSSSPSLSSSLSQSISVSPEAIETVKVLMRQGANPLDVNGALASSLHVASASGSVQLLELFLDIQNGISGCYSGDSEKNTPMHYAVSHNQPASLQVILSFMDKNSDGKDLELLAFKNEDQYTPLTLALDNKYTECVAEILKFPRIAKLNGSHYGNAPIHIATKNNDLQLVKSLIELKAEPEVTNNLGKTCLHIAVEHNFTEIVKTLLSKNFNVLVRDINGNTPLHYCTSLEIAKLLVPLVPRLSNLTFHITNKKGELPFQNINDPNFAELLSSLPIEPQSPTFNVQICSDLHIEFPHEIDITPRAPYLALLGDIGLCLQPKYRKFLLSCSDKFEKVFVILGNHEFYRMNVESAIKTTEDICNSRPNLIFMNRRSEEVNGVRILGCTLWSNISQLRKADIKMMMSDYRVITIEGEADITPADEADITPVWKDSFMSRGRVLGPDDTHKWHLEEVEWLKKEIELAKSRNEKVIVFTHHSPVLIGDSSSDDVESVLRSAFSTNLSDMFGEPLLAWCYGHTHWYNDITMNGTRVISNPHGYPREATVMKKSYDPFFVVSI